MVPLGDGYKLHLLPLYFKRPSLFAKYKLPLDDWEIIQF